MVVVVVFSIGGQNECGGDCKCSGSQLYCSDSESIVTDVIFCGGCDCGGGERVRVCVKCDIFNLLLTFTHFDLCLYLYQAVSSIINIFIAIIIFRYRFCVCALSSAWLSIFPITQLPFYSIIICLSLRPLL